jgi:hypothetical protein
MESNLTPLLDDPLAGSYERYRNPLKMSRRSKMQEHVSSSIVWSLAISVPPIVHLVSVAC